VQVATVEIYEVATEPASKTVAIPALAPVPAPELTSRAAAVVPAAPRTISWRSVITQLLETIWIIGSLACTVVALVRMIRFSRALRFATPAPPSVQARADELACRLRLRGAPKVQFIPGALCPMLWTAGSSARLLVPSALWQRLDEVQRDAVLLHELAHWARRDHWVRWIEILATTVYWWLPPCWLARRELREAEEQCCDAWVLWALPGKFRHYANALLEAVEFISIRADRPSALNAVPALASGMGQFRHLKRRLAMLKNGNVSRALSWGGVAAALGLGALLLPMSPILAQTAVETQPKPDVEIQQTRTVAVDATPTAETASPTEKTSTTVEDARMNDIMEKLAASQKQIEALTRRLEEANATIAVMKAGNQQQNPQIFRASPEVKQGGAVSVYSKVAPINPTPPATSAEGKFEFNSSLPLDPNVNYDPKSADQARRLVVADRRTGQIRTILVAPGDGGIAIKAAEASGAGSQAERLDRLEANLQAMLQEIKSIRAESGAKTATPSLKTAPQPAGR
jgi:beta-lactamase regulating signal transducer with metallopeptidase domain